MDLFGYNFTQMLSWTISWITVFHHHLAEVKVTVAAIKKISSLSWSSHLQTDFNITPHKSLGQVHTSVIFEQCQSHILFSFLNV